MAQQSGTPFVIIVLASLAMGLLVLLGLENTKFGREFFFTVKGIPTK